MANENRGTLAAWLLDKAREIQTADYQDALPPCVKVHNAILGWAESLQGDGQPNDGFEGLLSGLFGIVKGKKNDEGNIALVNFLCDADDLFCECIGVDEHTFGESAEARRTRMALAVEDRILATRLEKAQEAKKLAAGR